MHLTRRKKLFISARSQQKLVVLALCLNSFRRQCFAVAGPVDLQFAPDGLRES